MKYTGSQENNPCERDVSCLALLPSSLTAGRSLKRHGSKSIFDRFLRIIILF